jgi:NAD(P)-dependent dehydrogenase (short-subunit alcohol dehydrogenase family)
MATEFVRSGAAVAIVARDEAKLEAAVDGIKAATTTDNPDGRVAGFSCDVADGEALAATHARVVAELAPVDILVNNAGTSAARPFLESTDEDWQHDIDLKLMAAVRLSRLCVPAMQEQRWGRIINVLNAAAKAPGPRSAPTSVSRAAGMALTKVLAAELASQGILVNALNTGLLVTDQWARLHQERGPEMSYDEFIAHTGRAIPAGRMGDPTEFANLACFLASDRASYVTGTAINIDGGLAPVV